jgi:hypothetical protein
MSGHKAIHHTSISYRGGGMGKLDEILQQRKDVKQQAQKANEELEKYRKAILSGKESTGDPIKDFCIAHWLTDDTKKEEELRALTKRIVKGEPMLVSTRFTYVRDIVICHGFGAPPEYHNAESGFMRFAIAEEPVWSVNGLTMPTEHYAYTTSDMERAFSPEWRAHTSPLALTDAELLDHFHRWWEQSYEREKPKESDKDLTDEDVTKMVKEMAEAVSKGKRYRPSPRTRKDLPDEFWEEFNKGPGNYRSERGACHTTILVGDEAHEQFNKHWEWRWDGHRWHQDGHNTIPRDSLAEALFCVEHGMTQEEHAERERGAIYKRRWRIAEGLVRAMEAGEMADVKELLQNGIEAGVQELEWTRRTSKGVVYEFPDFFNYLCEKYGVKR